MEKIAFFKALNEQYGNDLLVEIYKQLEFYSAPINTVLFKSGDFGNIF